MHLYDHRRNFPFSHHMSIFCQFIVIFVIVSALGGRMGGKGEIMTCTYKTIGGISPFPTI